MPTECARDQKFDLNMFTGRWYITAGLNPLFDTFPCQEHYFGVPEPGARTSPRTAASPPRDHVRMPGRADAETGHRYRNRAPAVAISGQPRLQVCQLSRSTTLSLSFESGHSTNCELNFSPSFKTSASCQMIVLPSL